MCVCGGGAQQQLCLEEHPGNLFFECHEVSFFIIIIIIIVVIQEGSGRVTNSWKLSGPTAVKLVRFESVSVSLVMHW